MFIKRVLTKEPSKHCNVGHRSQWAQSKSLSVSAFYPSKQYLQRSQSILFKRTIEIQDPNPLAAARAWQIKLPLPDHLLSSIHPTTVAYAILQHQTKMISFQNAHPKIVQQTFQFNQVKAIKACQDVSVVFSFQKVVSKQRYIGNPTPSIGVRHQHDLRNRWACDAAVGCSEVDELKFSKLISFHWKTLT